MENGQVKVRCETCEDSYELSTKELNLICCEDTQTWAFSFFCRGCGRLEINNNISDDNLQRLLKCRTNIVVWKKPEIHESSDPELNNADLWKFQNLLDSTDYIVELVEAV